MRFQKDLQLDKQKGFGISSIHKNDFEQSGLSICMDHIIQINKPEQ